jgi:hypothetical protein
MLPPHLIREHSGNRHPNTDDSIYTPHYFKNITGFYREADAHYLNLTDPSSSNSSHGFFRHLQGDRKGSGAHSSIRSLVNQTSWNETEAIRERGNFDWEGVTSWSLNINEKEIIARDINGDIIVNDVKQTGKRSQEPGEEEDSWDDWTWIHVVCIDRSISDGDQSQLNILDN